MPTWLVTAALNWLYGKAAEWGGLLISWFREKGKQDELTEEREKRAQTLEEISAEIKALVLKGEPVPEELKMRFRNAKSKLVNYSLD
jgi:hypothetical protein